MNKEIENLIVSSFIEKRKKERIMFELLSEEKRNWCIWKLDDYFDNRYKMKIEKAFDSYEYIYNLLKKHGAPEKCYVMDTDFENDGKEFMLKQILKERMFWGPILISCIHGKLAYFEGEPTIGSTDRYLLVHK